MSRLQVTLESALKITYSGCLAYFEMIELFDIAGSSFQDPLDKFGIPGSGCYDKDLR